MHTDAVQMLFPARNFYLAVQQATLLGVVSGDVFVFPAYNRVFGEDGVAVIAIRPYAIFTVSELRPDAIGEKFILPASRQTAVTLMQATHFLQKNQVGVQVTDHLALL